MFTQLVVQWPFERKLDDKTHSRILIWRNAKCEKSTCTIELLFLTRILPHVPSTMCEIIDHQQRVIKAKAHHMCADGDLLWWVIILAKSTNREVNAIGLNLLCCQISWHATNRTKARCGHEGSSSKPEQPKAKQFAGKSNRRMPKPIEISFNSNNAASQHL